VALKEMPGSAAAAAILGRLGMHNIVDGPFDFGWPLNRCCERIDRTDTAFGQ
jgi:hypothetical protein